jgi:hypothetical protein
MRPENKANYLERYLSSEADSPLASQENSWLFESRELKKYSPLVPILRKINTFRDNHSIS